MSDPCEKEKRRERVHRLVILAIALSTTIAVLAISVCSVLQIKPPDALQIIAAGGIGALAGLVPPTDIS